MQDDRRAFTEQLAEDLRAGGLLVDLKIVEPHPGGWRVTLVEWTSITIASTMIFDGVFDAAKRSLIARYQARRDRTGKDGRPLGLVIYGPDGQALQYWDTRDAA